MGSRESQGSVMQPYHRDGAKGSARWHWRDLGSACVLLTPPGRHVGGYTFAGELH